MKSHLSAALLLLAAVAVPSSTDAYSSFTPRSFVGRRSTSSLSMNIETVKTKENVKVGVIGKLTLCLGLALTQLSYEIHS
jgi:hypothetical protein